MTYNFGDELLFQSPYDQYKEHNGKNCMVMKTTTLRPDPNGQEENQTIPIQFIETNEKIEALPEELHVSGWMFKQKIK